MLQHVSYEFCEIFRNRLFTTCARLFLKLEDLFYQRSVLQFCKSRNEQYCQKYFSTYSCPGYEEVVISTLICGL